MIFRRKGTHFYHTHTKRKKKKEKKKGTHLINARNLILPKQNNVCLP